MRDHRICPVMRVGDRLRSKLTEIRVAYRRGDLPRRSLPHWARAAFAATGANLPDRRTSAGGSGRRSRSRHRRSSTARTTTTIVTASDHHDRQHGGQRSTTCSNAPTRRAFTRLPFELHSRLVIALPASAHRQPTVSLTRFENLVAERSAASATTAGGLQSWSSTSPSRSPRVSATSTRSTTKPAGSAWTATSTPRWLPGRLRLHREHPGLRTAIRWTPGAAARVGVPRRHRRGRVRSAMFQMIDEAGGDDKVLCVPAGDNRWDHIQDIERHLEVRARRDRALLRALQGSRAGQARHRRWLDRQGRGREGRRGGHQAPQGAPRRGRRALTRLTPHPHTDRPRQRLAVGVDRCAAIRAQASCRPGCSSEPPSGGTFSAPGARPTS